MYHQTEVKVSAVGMRNDDNDDYDRNDVFKANVFDAKAHVHMKQFHTAV